MFTAVDIFNAALAGLAVDPISSWDDGSAAAKIGRPLYPIERDRLLSLYPWSFASDFAAPQRLAPAGPDDPFLYAVPPDALRIVTLLDERGDAVYYRREIGNRLRAMGEAASLVWISRTDEQLWPGFFAELLAAFLEARCCKALTGQDGGGLFNLAQTKFITAKGADAQQSSPRVLAPALGLLEGR
ncbi:hypothetical protein [Ferrovibrio sp.]|uniref:hypothetical protein n=1 Tax=Ferrovibrio sp. TaxID=1917215 RepID=UPI003D0C8C7C